MITWIILGVVVLIVVTIVGERIKPGSMLGEQRLRVRNATTQRQNASARKSHGPRKGHGEFQQEVVGESHYQKVLEGLVAGQIKRFFKATLVPEDTNVHDNKAVRVDIENRTVGYLPRDAARAWREEDGRARASAYLISAGKGTSIGVWLRFE